MRSEHLAGLALALTALLSAGCRREPAPTPAGQSPAPAPKTITLPNGLTMVLIPAGEFIMGDNTGDADEKPAHKVQVGAFYMDTHEVTQQAYESLTRQNPSKSKGPDQPVEQVDWYHAILYCNLRSLKESLKPCYDTKTLACDFAADGYRLPTEAEWEYACRAGTQEQIFLWQRPGPAQNTPGSKPTPPGDPSRRPKGPQSLGPVRHAWQRRRVVPRHLQRDLLPAEREQGPARPIAGDKRVLRGGSWRASEDGCRSSVRNSETPRFADACFGSDAYGFRCVRNADFH